MQPISREDARTAGLTMYFTGIPCKNLHVEPRYTNTGICYGCKREQAKRDYEAHPDRVGETNTRSRKKNQARISATSKRWSRQNPEKSRAIKDAYKARNNEKVRTSAREYERKRRQDPTYRLFSAASKSVWDFLQGAKARRPFLSLVDWTADELLRHLEAQFTPEMTWDNYGEFWHVDHIIPLSMIRMFPTRTEPEDLFKLFWCLDNLRPLPKRENLARGNRADPAEMLAVATAYLIRIQTRLEAG